MSKHKFTQGAQGAFQTFQNRKIHKMKEYNNIHKCAHTEIKIQKSIKKGIILKKINPLGKTKIKN